MYSKGHDPSSGYDGVESIAHRIGRACAFDGNVRSQPTGFSQNAVAYVFPVNENEGIRQTKLLGVSNAFAIGSGKYHSARTENSRDLACDHTGRPWTEYDHRVARTYATLGDCSPDFHVKNGGYFV